jgi:cellulose synthase/poly-beta-1,6-N-acetylglucosamine synthase-like glycosyltransferase
MWLLLEGMAWAMSLLVACPALTLLVEVVAAALPERERGGPDPGPLPARVAVIVPAHDEAGQIEDTVRALSAELPPGARLLVVADNCSDETAVLAARAGASVIERRDPERVGKGFAISFALHHLDAEPPDVVILVDADCRVSPGGLATLARAASQAQRPVQAEYLLGAPQAAGPTTVISALAILLRNRVRPRGLRRLGLPCQLTGSGMAFPWPLLRHAPETGSNLVEDLVMGIELALRGTPPLLCPSAQISSDLPTDRSAGFRQRRRWEHGQLHTLRVYAPRLAAAGLVRRQPALLAMALDLLVPPLALLVMIQVLTLAVTAGLAMAGLVSTGPASLAALAFGALAAAVAVAWIRFGRKTLPLRYALLVPLYVLWKVPLYVVLAIRGRQRSWERTSREPRSNPEGPEAAPPR